MNSRLQGWLVHQHEVVVSTMDLARAALEDSSDRHPFVIVAKAQSGGRGRQGRVWESPVGGLYLTAVYPWDREIGALSGLSLVVGLALRESLGAAAAQIYLKWPNDLITDDGRKLAGILIEVSNGSYGASVLIGIGLNLQPVVLKQRCSGAAQSNESAISLSELTGRIDPGEKLLDCLLGNLLQVLERFKQVGFAPFRDSWCQFSALNGCRIEIDCGGKVSSGRYAGVSNSGALLLESDQGVCEIASGHILGITRA